jgi:hypothetical protein
MKKNIFFYLFVFIILFIWFVYVYSKKYAENFDENFPNVAIITAIYGDYDNLKDPNIDYIEKVDWYCFTDNNNIKSNFWKIINTPYHLNSNTNDNYKNSYSNIKDKKTYNMMCAKYYKMKNHEIDILNKYDYIVWIDGSIILRKNFIENVSNNILKKDIELANFKHSVRNNIKDETNVSIEMEKYKTQGVDKQYNHYIANGFDDSVGLFENTIIIRKKTDRTNDIFDTWWLHNLIYSYQDQISYPYVLWEKNFLPDFIINENVFNNNNYSFVDFKYMKNH